MAPTLSPGKSRDCSWLPEKGAGVGNPMAHRWPCAPPMRAVPVHTCGPTVIISISFLWMVLWTECVCVSPQISMTQPELLQVTDAEVGLWEAEWSLMNGISAVIRGGR